MFTDDCIKEFDTIKFDKKNNRILALQKEASKKFLINRFAHKLDDDPSFMIKASNAWNFIAGVVNKKFDIPIIQLNEWNIIWLDAVKKTRKKDERKASLAIDNILNV